MCSKEWGKTTGPGLDSAAFAAVQAVSMLRPRKEYLIFRELQ